MNAFFAFAIIGPVGQVGRGSYLPLCHSSQNLSHNEISTLCFWCLFNQTELYRTVRLLLWCFLSI